MQIDIIKESPFICGEEHTSEIDAVVKIVVQGKYIFLCRDHCSKLKALLEIALIRGEMV